MPRLPVINFKTLDKILKGLGFKAIRQKGSHVFYRHPNGLTTTAPNHKGYDIARPLLRDILRDIELTTAQFLRLLRKK